MATPYQLALVTPGRYPSRASLRKQILQSSNLRIYPRGRPQSLQRLRCRTLNLGFLAALAKKHVRATKDLLALGKGEAQLGK